MFVSEWTYGFTVCLGNENRVVLSVMVNGQI